jgi:HTH-type transcriptional regulator, cell division transcriptional repressor
MQAFEPRRIREERKKIGWSQADLAREAGLSLSGISMIELGNKIPRVSTVMKISEALGCNYQSFFIELNCS